MGYCSKHYRRLKAGGDPQYTKRPSEDDRFWSKVDIAADDECWEWNAGEARGGYGKYAYRGKTITAHRMSYIIANGAIPDGLMICHSCDNRKCVNPAHLWTGTHMDNMTDCLNKHRTLKGEKNGNSKLNNNDVLKIRRLLKDGWTLVGLAKKFGVSTPVISNIRDNKNWSHVR
jgi:hypothetical protein